MSGNLVPLTIIKGAGHEYIPLPQGENATVADFHSIRTNTKDTPSYFTSGFYKIEAGPARPAHYTFEETKYILNGQIDILDVATGIQHHLVPGDFAFFRKSFARVCVMCMLRAVLMRIQMLAPRSSFRQRVPVLLSTLSQGPSRLPTPI